MKAGELVGEGEGAHGRLQADALERHRELAGDGRAGRECRGLDGQEAQRAALPHQGQDGEAAGPSPAGRWSIGRMRRVSMRSGAPGLSAPGPSREEEHPRPRDGVVALARS